MTEMVAPCLDCDRDTFPHERYSVFDAVWEQAGNPDGSLCIGCLEMRLERSLVLADFRRVPLNDDSELDSVRFRYAKGSGRQTEDLYRVAAAAVELGIDSAQIAEALRLDAGLVDVWAENARQGREFEAEMEDES